MSPEDRTRIENLLQDETLSYRAIGRETGYSDFTIRAVARELAGDPRPLKSPRSQSNQDSASMGLGGWGILAGLTGLFVGAIFLWNRNPPPPDV
jgi:hypothetical protein